MGNKTTYEIAVVAFLVALHQNKQLLGLQGLLPAQSHLDRWKNQAAWDKVSHVPSLIWLVDYNKYLDDFLDYVAYAGLGLSGKKLCFLSIYTCALLKHLVKTFLIEKKNKTDLQLFF